MYKFVVIYNRVDDEAALETFFAGTHLALVEQLPGLRRLEVSRVASQPLGRSRFHLMVEAYFDDEVSMQQGLTSEPGIALMNALRPWADNRLITWFYANAFEEAKNPGIQT
ncbi:MAG TPA: EthD family reductase [Promineifilum sp.]